MLARVLKGSFQGKGLRIAVVVARFNQVITEQLLKAAQHTLISNGVSADDIVQAKVPGAFELPVVARKLAGTGQFDAVVCLGAVIKGETPHFHYVASQVASGISRASLDTGIPVIFGVLTTENIDQAINRAGGEMPPRRTDLAEHFRNTGVKIADKGADAALSAIEMANVMRQIQELKLE